MATQTYRVEPGDYMALIAKKFYGDESKWEVIYAANREQIGPDPKQLRAGMVLTIPDAGGTQQPSGGFSTEAQPPRYLTPAESDQVAIQVARALMRDFGLSSVQAAGVLGNLFLESAGMNSNINQEYGFEGRGGPGEPSADMNQGYGWCQWSYDRKRAYLNFAASKQAHPGSPAANYAFLEYELKNTELTTIPALRREASPEGAATAFRREFERAEQPHDAGRIAQANRIAGLL